MDSIAQLIRDVLVREGGSAYTNDPQDAGGPTKYGITLGTLHNWRKAPVSAYDVQQLAESEAVEIYRKMYFPTGYEAIPDPALLALLFDYGVNSGPGTAVKSLQTVLKRLGYYTGDVDGGFGPKSAAALRQVQNWPALFYAVKCERLEGLLRYIGASPGNARYAAGWSNRNDQFELKFS